MKGHQKLNVQYLTTSWNFRYETVPRRKEQFDLWRHVLFIAGNFRYEAVPRRKEQFDLWHHVLFIAGNFRYEAVPRRKEQFDLWHHVLFIAGNFRYEQCPEERNSLIFNVMFSEFHQKGVSTAQVFTFWPLTKQLQKLQLYSMLLVFSWYFQLRNYFNFTYKHVFLDEQYHKIFQFCLINVTFIRNYHKSNFI